VQPTTRRDDLSKVAVVCWLAERRSKYGIYRELNLNSNSHTQSIDKSQPLFPNSRHTKASCLEKSIGTQVCFSPSSTYLANNNAYTLQRLIGRHLVFLTRISVSIDSPLFVSLFGSHFDTFIVRGFTFNQDSA